MVNNTSVKALFQVARSEGQKQKRCCIVMDEVDGCDRWNAACLTGTHEWKHESAQVRVYNCHTKLHPVRLLRRLCSTRTQVDLKFQQRVPDFYFILLCSLIIFFWKLKEDSIFHLQTEFETWFSGRDLTQLM